MRATAVLVFVTSLLAAVKCQQSGSIRLYNNGYSNTSTAGVVEVYYKRWNTVCQYDAVGNLYWGQNEADVACHQLGYTGASSFSSSGATNYGDDYNAIGFNSVYCSDSSYLVLLQCEYSIGTVSTYCSNDDQVTVSCYNTLLTDSPFTGMVRLQGGINVNWGRAEVYCNGQWGTLCYSSNFTSYVADTFCYQLGYNDCVTYVAGAIPGSSSQPIWLSDYNCSAGYSCISSCQTCPAANTTSCQHSQDVSLSCEYDLTSSNHGTTLNTCNFYYWSAAAIVGIIVGVLGAIILCLCLSIGIPVCICWCLGVGIGSVASGIGSVVRRHHLQYDAI